MTAQEYILEQLNELRNRTQQSEFTEDQAEIKRLLLSKKFRKYAATPELIENVESAIKTAVENRKPIEIVYVHGGYKLWRLDESPEADWAELFALLYYVKWLKPVSAAFKYGVHFDLYVDDWIVPILNNVPQSDVDTYIESERRLIDFLKPYMPDNLTVTLHTVGSQFVDLQVFNDSLDKNYQLLESQKAHTEIVLSQAQEKMIDLNVKPLDTPQDKFWKQKIQQLHDAYSLTKKETNYYYRPDKIIAFCTPFGNGMALALGTTKDSIAKFWVGVGALKPSGDSFRQLILSPQQLDAADCISHDLHVDGLEGKNFKKIRVLAN